VDAGGRVGHRRGLGRLVGRTMKLFCVFIKIQTGSWGSDFGGYSRSDAVTNGHARRGRHSGTNMNILGTRESCPGNRLKLFEYSMSAAKA
jgi:hypothetical protein